ncbi:DNA translocase FtsK [Nitratireductor sp. L1-7-SE]|uniref:DNA translocase FtsK n=1 Tax=Nitratireductor rhodophyticola TaxID=2854036 RepID=A0ABS7R8H4_9HYPH|nr:DNA translocase FtsK [Nitratireductor rhodophyticola]MBY8916266.1 DNA translocase FtsK [Nitratireductor rhodophyticola]MBY8921629.1 DNA translocase FtsK [Nitratireductor rhodophyticola]
MSSGSSAFLAMDENSYGLQAFLRRQAARAGGLALLAFVAFAVAALATWNVADPSFSHATANPVTNAMGYPGAVFSDLAMQFYGLAALVGLVPAVCWGALLLLGRQIDRGVRRAGSWFLGAVLAAGIVGAFAPPPTWPLPTGLGGVLGDMILSLPAKFIGAYPRGFAGFVIAAILAVPAGWLLAYGAGLISRPGADDFADDMEDEAAFDTLDDEEESGGSVILGYMAHWWLSFCAFFRRNLVRAAPRESQRVRAADMDEDGDMPFDDFDMDVRSEDARVEPDFDDAPAAPRVRVEPEFDAPALQPAAAQPRQVAPVPAAQRVENPAPRPVEGARVRREAQPSFLDSGTFELPELHLLAEPKTSTKDPSLSRDALEQNARLLEGVLEDFGVKGEIIHVRPGPVVTLYELEPAPGIKSSRVIGLADDIARSMSAIAARVAVVPGRNAIGIELPNSTRETVYLRELLASRDFEASKAKLALSLGKTINGEAVIADLAKMPHLLVAGTTGSGKSVAINTMILSLLYRMTPEQCRLIMIDPKMLELSIYDGIPHLLTPVVTDPKKAVVALKWTVREMEDRYRKMSKVGVRNIEGFNQRVVAAKKKGETIKRTVQTGFDRETGEAIYESEDLDLEPMPFIVVIIDEMADLMMVAGKDIEGAVQRLAQMARAAGIHVIMATQRPSVDVITGTIKANFPTRISFQVTSKIDSRTILGEQGAEQLLGMGDMLYMAGGGRIQRVHGPFVSDGEVESIVNHLKMQGVPDYLDAVTEDEEEDDGGSAGGGGSGGGNLGDSADPYDQAVAVVLRDGKASTSYIQRRLGIGYNRAASIIERMEDEGIVGPANHAGKREILVPTEQDEV